MISRSIVLLVLWKSRRSKYELYFKKECEMLSQTPIRDVKNWQPDSGEVSSHTPLLKAVDVFFLKPQCRSPWRACSQWKKPCITIVPIIQINNLKLKTIYSIVVPPFMSKGSTGSLYFIHGAVNIFRDAVGIYPFFSNLKKILATKGIF